MYEDIRQMFMNLKLMSDVWVIMYTYILIKVNRKKISPIINSNSNKLLTIMFVINTEINPECIRRNYFDWCEYFSRKYQKLKFCWFRQFLSKQFYRQSSHLFNREIESRRNFFSYNSIESYNRRKDFFNVFWSSYQSSVVALILKNYASWYEGL